MLAKYAALPRAAHYGFSNQAGCTRGLNKVTLIGNLGQDPQMQVLEGNVAVAKFSLATSESFRDKNGQLHTSTDWHSVVLWRGLAELAQAYLRKGSLVYLEGKLKTRHYDDASGQRYYVAEVVGEQVFMLDKKALRYRHQCHESGCFTAPD